MLKKPSLTLDKFVEKLQAGILKSRVWCLYKKESYEGIIKYQRQIT